MKAKRTRQVALALVLLLAASYTYIEFNSAQTRNMTARQKILKAIYPAIMGIGKLFGSKSKIIINPTVQPPPVSFYSLSAQGGDGKPIDFSAYRGKKLLLVNTASECGYTAQYDELQKLYEKYRGTLVIIAFPANDFQQQEKGTDQEIASFCKLNYGVNFPLAKKSMVIKGPGQNPVFEWLSHREKNGWLDQQPTWNFSKYLVSEQGVLTSYFDPSVSPLGPEISHAVGH